MNLIQLLLGGQSALTDPRISTETDPQDIQVMGRPNNPLDAPPPEGPQIRTERPVRRRVYDNSRDHEGLFGVHGGLRDILGALGDTYGGNGPRYAEKRRDEKLSDALVGFTENPLKAFERLAAVPGGQDMAQKAYHDFGQAQSLAADRDASAQLDQAKVRELNVNRFLNNAGSILGTVNGDPSKYGKLVPIIKQRMEELGITDLPLPDAYGSDAEDAIQAIREAGIGLKNKTRLDQTGANTDSMIEDRKVRQGLTARGQDVSTANNVRSTSTSAANNQRSVAATVRGQDMTQGRYDNGQQGRSSNRRTGSGPATSGPQRGFKKGGYTFQGGNPADPKSWKKD